MACNSLDSIPRPCNWSIRNSHTRPAVHSETKVNKALHKTDYFQVGQDERVTAECQRSIYKESYPRWLNADKTELARPLAPAEIIIKDDRLRQVNSETRTEFNYKGYDKPDYPNFYLENVSTHFQTGDPMWGGSDYRSMTEASFVLLPIPCPDVGTDKLSFDPHKTSIVHGDVDNCVRDGTEYSRQYREKSSQRPKPFNDTTDGFPPVGGDQRMHSMNTTSREITQDVTSEDPPIRGAPVITPLGNVIQYDERDLKGIQSEFQVMYNIKAPEISTVKDSYVKNFKTNFHMGSHPHADAYMTTSRAAHPRFGAPCVDIARADMNKSSIELGDPERKVANESEYARHYKDRLRYVDRSRFKPDPTPLIQMGDPNLKTSFYETTSNDAFRNHKYEAPVRYYGSTHSSIPLDVYKQKDSSSTYDMAFKRFDQCKVSLNPEIVKTFKSCSIIYPYGEQMFAESEQKSQFRPWVTKERASSDSNKERQERSSVPIGTLNEPASTC